MNFKLKFLQYLGAVALCFITSFAFTSCDDDDEPENNSIVGTWLRQDDVDATYVFNSDNTGLWYSNTTDQTEEFDYNYNGTTLIIKWATWGTDILNVKWASKNSIHLYYENGEYYVLNRK